jgi:hypothetical protein
MSELTSRIILGIEAIVIGLPLSLLFLVAGLPSAFYFAFNFPDAGSLAFAGTNLIILATLSCAWVLMFAFSIRGGGALRNLSIYWWFLPFLSGGLGLSVTLYLWSAEVIEPSSINTFGWGLPLLVPLTHLCIERWLRSSANPPLNRTRADNARAS